ncbi:diguanylate cyclase/phosphodiesterase (GGDEF & EAL domains) with PAS/PAC sensor(s) [hydrothermal vent metagenome]|uniref:Diguanylate cyclase/phosphodiesterase (GGDEF & EAL domains) with PAS/PAC sensor(S) n=1 Tax=hydrothermal vent metagenome TaxID=652676 RepID=A0A3B0W604_9ZZZZ
MILRVKLNLLLIAILVLTNGSLAYFLSEKQKDIISNNIDIQAEAISTLIAKDAIQLILLNTSDYATDLSSKLSSLKTLSKTNIYNASGKNILTIQNQSYLNEHNLIKKELPLSFLGSTLGHVELFFTKDSYNEAADRLTLFLMQIFAAGLALTLLFALYIDHFFSKRISQLNNALKNTSNKQDYSIRLPEKHVDEIGKAYQSFNQLVENTEQLLAKQATQEQLLLFQANHDTLTGLHNRLYITTSLKKLIAEDGDKETHALCYFDLDKFKIINDSFGHPVGDQLLIKLAVQFEQFINTLPQTQVARIGGDEFILIVQNTSEEALLTPLKQLQSLIKNFRLDHQGQQLSVGVSIGAILFKTPYDNIHSLFAAADTACYHAKHKGGNSLSIFWQDNPELQNEKALVNWVQRIRNAIANHQLLVYLQPIINSRVAQDNKPSYESLVRLQEENNIISPFAFIPTLERFKMMPEVDFYMVQEVISHLSKEPEFLNKVNHISINLSGTTLTIPNAADSIIQIIERSKLPFHKFCFEITETSAVSNLTEAKLFIEQLSKKGCLFSLDDFGTGMASFEYLHALPLNTLKIDGCFIKDIAKDPIKFEMVKSMQNIANLMNLETVAEYVENQAIIDKLNEIGIHHHQGYHYSEPRPIQEIMNPEQKHD